MSQAPTVTTVGGGENPFADDVTFSRWYRDAVGRVYGYLFSRVGSDVALAEELTQQTFIAAVQTRSRFDGRADPMTWVLAIARNKLIDQYRRQVREGRRHLRLVEIAVAGDADTGAWQAREHREDVTAALDAMPPAQRAALVLHHVDGLSVEEVGRALGRSPSAIESLLARGRESFRRTWEAQRHG